ncbi:MAG: HigA family addiction module antitoxin [Chloroflexota bacterium]
MQIFKYGYPIPNRHKPVHPGEILLEEFLKPMNLSQNRLAIDIGVDARRINEIVLGKRSITADTALRLARYFGTSPQFWLGLQAEYDLDVTLDSLGNRLEREVRPRVPA